MQQGVSVEHECLQVHETAHLWGQALQAVLTEVQVQQVREVDEELVGDGVDAAGGREREKGRGRQGPPVSATRPASRTHLASTVVWPCPAPASGLTGTCCG